jgi:LEA14-like dessication related protein
MGSMKSRLGAPCVVLALLVAACAGVRGMEPPEVSLVGLEVLPGGSLEQRFAVELRVLNPNERELHVDGIDFTLEVNGSRLTRGVSSQEVAVPRLGEALLTVTATTTVFDLLRQALNATEARELTYEIHGRVFVANSPASLPFSRSGRVASPR